MRSLAVIIEQVPRSESVLADTATVTGRGTLEVDGFSEEQGLPLATSGDLSRPPAATSTGHQRGLSHGHGVRHEALFDRVGMKGPHRRPVAAGR